MNIEELKLVKEIGEQYKDWTPNSNILISAGMGTGKTTFALDVLGAYAKRNNKRILYLSNRKALNKEIYDKINDNKLKGIVFPITYHKLQKVLLDKGKNKAQNKIDKSIYDDIDYIICDECHYFITDSWTNITDISYEYILNHQQAIKLYMSATGFYLYDILENDLQKLNKKKVNYYLPNDFSHVEKINFFSQQEYVNNLINSLPAHEKLIYFNRKLDNLLELHEQYKDNSSFVCSDKNKQYKDNITKDALVNHKLTNQLTFVTTVWDNGINIIDSSVRHIVIDIVDLVTLIQCIGRRRIINDNDKVILHIRNWNKEELTQFINPKFAQRKLNDLFINENEEYLKQLKIGEVEKGICLYNDFSSKELTLNRLMDKNIRIQIDEYYHATVKNNSFAEFINKIIKCENIELIDYSKDIKHQQILELELYLNNIDGEHLYNEHQQEICTMIKDIKGIKSKYKLRGKTIQPAKLRTILNDELKLEYEISDVQQESKKDNRKRYIVISKFKIKINKVA